MSGRQFFELTFVSIQSFIIIYSSKRKLNGDSPFSWSNLVCLDPPCGGWFVSWFVTSSAKSYASAIPPGTRLQRRVLAYSCHKAPKKTKTKSEQFILEMNCAFSMLLRIQLRQSETNKYPNYINKPYTYHSLQYSGLVKRRLSTLSQRRIPTSSSSSFSMVYTRVPLQVTSS